MEKKGKEYLVTRYSEIYGVTKTQARLELDRFPDFVARILIENDEINFNGYMRFTKKVAGERKWYNPATGEMSILESKNKINCKIGNKLKDLVGR